MPKTKIGGRNKEIHFKQHRLSNYCAEILLCLSMHVASNSNYLSNQAKHKDGCGVRHSFVCTQKRSLFIGPKFTDPPTFELM